MRTFALLFLALASPLFGDLHSELNDFFERFGSQSNVSSADIYKEPLINSFAGS